MTHPLALAGATQAAAHADRKSPGWSETAFEFFCTHAASLGVGAKFTTEEIRAAAESEGLPPPPDRRAWGAISVKAKRAGKIVHVGYAPAKAEHVHGCLVNVWTCAGVTQ